MVGERVDCRPSFVLGNPGLFKGDIDCLDVGREDIFLGEVGLDGGEEPPASLCSDILEPGLKIISLFGEPGRDIIMCCFSVIFLSW